jgi:hypothetical protein
MPLSPRLQKLHVDSLVVCHGMAFSCFSCSPLDLNSVVTNCLLSCYVKWPLLPGDNPTAVNKYYHYISQSLVVCHGMVFLKTRPFVKWNNAEFTDVCSFTLLLMCSKHFTLSCRILLLPPPPPPTIFSSLFILKSPDSLPGGCCLGFLLW